MAKINAIVIFGIIIQLFYPSNARVADYEDSTISYNVFQKGNSSRLSISKDIKEIQSERNYTDKSGNEIRIKTYLAKKNETEEFQKFIQEPDDAFDTSISSDPEKDVVNDTNIILDDDQNSQAQNTKSDLQGRIDYEKYYSYDEMVDFLQFIQNVRNPTYNKEHLAELEIIGKSYEKRDLYLVKISSNHSANNPIIFFEAGMHAREWTSPASALYMISQLVEYYTENVDVLRNVDFYIIPLANPDGYQYSRKEDRFWRKTRSAYHGAKHGVDGNRNFDFHWDAKGGSGNPESEIFRGPHPFSEPETRSIVHAARRYLDRIAAFISIHAYGSLILYPWSYDKNEYLPGWEVVHQVAEKAAEAIRENTGIHYEVGNSANLTYPSPGSSDDYFRGVLGITFSYTFELSSGGINSFMVPSARLLEISTAAFEGFKVIAREATAYWGIQERPENEYYFETYDVDDDYEEY